jgi:hypothetical protein
MEPLRIQATLKTPEVILDPLNNTFAIKGKSIPDDAEAFYQEILTWFDDYALSPNSETILIVDLEYFNISSSKRLLFLFYRLNDMVLEGSKVRIQWMYNEEDEDMFEVGQDYAFMVKIPFDFLSYNMPQLEQVAS